MQDVTILETPKIDEGLRLVLSYYLREEQMIEAGQWPRCMRTQTPDMTPCLIGATNYINQLHAALGLEPIEPV